MDNYIYVCERERERERERGRGRNRDNLPDFNCITIRHMINSINETVTFVIAQNNLAQYKKKVMSV
jgi:hypothetical protein